MKGRNIQQALVKVRMSEDELTELWYELGHQFLSDLNKRIRHKFAFDMQFSSLRKYEAFNGITVADLFGRLTTSVHFWHWWLNCLSYACNTIVRLGNDKQGSERTYLINILRTVEYIPDYVITKTLGIHEHKKRFSIRQIGDVATAEKRDVQQIV